MVIRNTASDLASIPFTRTCHAFSLYLRIMSSARSLNCIHIWMRYSQASGWDLANWLERLAVNAATVLGSFPASSDTGESEGRQMKQCWITYIKRKKPKYFFELLISDLSGVANLILIQASLTGQPLAETVQLASRLNKVELKAGLRIRIGSGFNRVSGSGSGSRRAKMTHKSRIFFFKVHVLKCWMASF